MIEDVIPDGELDLFQDLTDEFSGDFFSDIFSKNDDDENSNNNNNNNNNNGSSRSPSPSSCVEDSQWIKEIENMLFHDDSIAPATTVLEDDFFADLELPQPLENNCLPEEEEGIRVSVDDEEFFSNILVDDGAQIVFSNTDHLSPESSEDPALETHHSSEHCQKKKSRSASEEEEEDDPISKKLKRQIRNRDAAVRSRERKKEHVKDLELKSKYLESECIRLQRLLHYCSAQNHALHLQLQEKAYAASRTKQESAVLLLESLLLGSLLWFLGMLSLLSPLEMHLQLPANALESVDSSYPKAVDLVALGRAKNENIGLGTLRLFFKRKRCKATRSRMRALDYDGAVVAVAC